MSPPPKRRRIDVPNQVDEDTVNENEANGESESTQEQTTMVLSLQSGKSWAEVEGKLRGCYSGTSIQTSKRRQAEKKESKKHARKFNKMTKYFPTYETGAGAVIAQQQVQAFSSKKFKSHRKAPEDDGT